MIVICPTCRAPSNTTEADCWVCRRHFDGSEPVIGDLPGARTAFRLADLRGGAYSNESSEIPAWRRSRAG